MTMMTIRNGDKVDHNPMNTILGKRRRRFKVFTPSPHIWDLICQTFGPLHQTWKEVNILLKIAQRTFSAQISQKHFWCEITLIELVSRTYDEIFPLSLISVKIIADLKGSAWWCWLIWKVVPLQLGLKMRCVDWRTSAIFVFLANRKTPFYPLTSKRYSMHHYFQESFPKHHPSARKYGLKKKLMHM